MCLGGVLVLFVKQHNRFQSSKRVTSVPGCTAIKRVYISMNAISKGGSSLRGTLNAQGYNFVELFLAYSRK